MDQLSQLQQLRADSEPMTGNRVHVDGEAEFISLFVELDHAAMAGELLEVGDRQDRCAVQGVQHGGHALALVPSNKRNVALPRVPRLADPPRQNRVAVDGLAREALFQGILELGGSQHTKGDGSGSGRAGIARPLDKSREVI